MPKENVGSYMVASQWSWRTDEPFESSTSYSPYIQPFPFRTTSQSFGPISMYGPARNNYWRISPPNINRYYRPIEYDGFDAPPPYLPFNYYVGYNYNNRN